MTKNRHFLADVDYECPKVPIFFGANQHEGAYVYGVAYNYFLKPNNLTNNVTFLKYHLVETTLRMVEISQGYAFSDQISEMYFDESQLGDLKQMTAGMIDVRPYLSTNHTFKTILKKCGLKKTHFY